MFFGFGVESLRGAALMTRLGVMVWRSHVGLELFARHLCSVCYLAFDACLAHVHAVESKLVNDNLVGND